MQPDPSLSRVPTLWATVTGTSPLTVVLDFTTRPAPASFLAGGGFITFTVGRRVICQIVNNQILVVG